MTWHHRTRHLSVVENICSSAWQQAFYLPGGGLWP
jgi:hypothetical protein